MDDVRNPVCTRAPEARRAASRTTGPTLHLHGGITPWISDGTPHQWITPAGETTAVAAGRQRPERPRHGTRGSRLRRRDDGCQTFFYTNQQSARLMFYHDHAWGITRLNVYAGEAAGYLITDADRAEARSARRDRPRRGRRASRSIVQDKTFVPDDAPAGRRRTRPGTRPGGAARATSGTTTCTCPPRTPATPSGMSAYGRWMYGPWFWPPATGAKYGPIAEPVLRRDLQGRRPVDLDVPDRPVLRAAADPRHAEHLGRHGAVQRHADRQRHGLPEGHPGAEGVPAPDAERGQRPVLQPPVVRRRSDPASGNGTTEVELEPGRARGGPDRPERLPDAGRRAQRRRRSGLGPDRHRGRLPAGPDRRRRPAADHLDHRPDPVRRRQRRPALAAAGTGRASRRRSSTSRSSRARR